MVHRTSEDSQLNGADRPLLNDIELPLDGVDVTDKLKDRPSRPPNFELEAASLKRLSKTLLEPKAGILRDLTDLILEVCGADSAGISIAEKEGVDDIFRWHAVSGQMEQFLHGTMPRNFSPCGVVIDRCSTLLLEKPIRHWGYIEKLGLPLHEVLLTPFFKDGEAIGTIWAVSHRAEKQFDLEDKRVLNSLAEMAALAVETNNRMTELSAAHQTEKIKSKNTEQNAREIANERDNLLRLFDANPSPNVLWRGEELIYERVSPTYQALVPGRQLIGKPVHEAMPEPEYEHFFEIIRGVFRTGEPVTTKEQLVWFDIDGTGMKKRYYTLSFFQVKDADGHPYGVYQQAVDNTEQIQAREVLKASTTALEEEQLKLKTVIENSTASIAILRGENFIYEQTNKSYAELFNNRELIGKPLVEALPELKDQEFPKLAKSVFETGIPYVDHEALALLKRTDQGPIEERYFNQTYSRILDKNGQPYGIFMHAQEVTDRVIARRELQQSKEEADKANRALELEQRRLANEKDNLAEALESMSDGFFSVDKDWNITHVNRVMEQTTGLPREKLIGQNHLKLFFSDPALHATNDWREYHRVMRDRVASIYEDYYPPTNKWNLIRLFPKADGGIAIFFTDITVKRIAEKLLKETEENYRSIAEATPLIVWTSTPEGAVSYANTKWYEFSGLTEEQTLGSGFTSIIHPDDLASTLKNFGEALTLVKPLEIEHRFKRASDGQYRWFLTRALPNFDEHGKPKKWFGTNIDIHDQKLAAAELIIAKREAERANQTKSAFLANMSHEIRTPLGTILGFADLLKSADLKPEERGYLDVINRNGQALSHVIDDILDLSKVEAGQLTIELVPFKLRLLVKDVVQLFSDGARSKGIALRFESDLSENQSVVSDQTRIRQILVNLIGNAVKFTAQGRIDVSVRTTHVKGAHSKIEIRVKDTGIGLTSDQSAKLFMPFVQADDKTTRKFGGTGLGLALCKRLANALLGDVSIEQSVINLGSTFLFSFHAQISDVVDEIQPDAIKTVSSAITGALSLAGRNILVVDDSPDNRALMNLLLKKAGAKVEQASSGEDAINLVAKNEYDVILMDIQMPGMDGYDTLKEIKKTGNETPIIALTAHALIEERRRTADAGFDDHVTKPVQAPVLIASILKQTKNH